MSRNGYAVAWLASFRGSGSTEETLVPRAMVSSCMTSPVSGSIHMTRCPLPFTGGATTRSSTFTAEVDGSRRSQGLHACWSAFSPKHVMSVPRYLCQTISEVVASIAKSLEERVTAMMSLSAPKLRNSSLLVGTRAFGMRFIDLRFRERLGVTHLVTMAASSMGFSTSSARRAGIVASCSSTPRPRASLGLAALSAREAAAERA
mmetsp:Transcript_61250/g.161008  ORF Transcript_61250/g.161008 Transcript_61250/m.161008 type:complete len:204 (-) Transcript_61250:441-1052(-)